VSKRKLPLESPNWWPIREALEHRCQQTGSDTLAAQDFNQKLRADRLRALVRRKDGRRELLPAAAWDNFYVGMWTFDLRDPPGPKWEVFSHSHKGDPPPGHWFFVWKPDYERIFGAGSIGARGTVVGCGADAIRGAQGEGWPPAQARLGLAGVRGIVAFSS